MSYDQKIDDSPIVVHFNPGKLSDLAMVSFAATLMLDKVRKKRQNPEAGIDLNSVDLNGISLSSSIESAVNELVECYMADAQKEWCLHHGGNVFSQRVPVYAIIDCLDQLVWLPGGTINYRQTAKKLINCDKLTTVQKFELACSYCFVEDVEYLKNTLTNAEINQPDEIEGSRMSDDLILMYWRQKLKLGTEFISHRNNPAWTSYAANLIDRVICGVKHYDEWLSIEYFFNRLCNEYRLIKANFIIDRQKFNYTCHILPILTGSEFNSVIRGKSREIMMTLVKNSSFLENTLSVWRRMTHLIDNGALTDILIRVNDLNYGRSYVNSLLWEMWLGTSERQKKFIVDGRVCDFVENLNDDIFLHTPNFRLIIDILSRSGPERRLEYFTAHWPYLIIGQLHERNFIDRIMKMCIGNDQQIETFKNTVMIDYDSVLKYCDRLIKCGHIDEISRYLDFCTTEQQVIRYLKRMIISKVPEKDLLDILYYDSNVEKMAHFNRYLDEIFTKSESKEFLCRIVTHPDNLKVLRSRLNYQFQSVIEFVEKYVSCEESLLKVKLNFFQICRRNDNVPNFVVFDLATWCFKGDKTEAEKLKRLIG